MASKHTDSRPTGLYLQHLTSWWSVLVTSSPWNPLEQRSPRVPYILQRLHRPAPLYTMMFLSLRLPQLKCRSWFLRPNKVSFLHSQCCSSLFSSHSKRTTLTQSLISVAARQSLRDRLRTRDSEAQRNCCSLAWGLQFATVMEVALSTLTHLLWLSLKMRKEPLSAKNRRNSSECLLERNQSEVSYLYRRWCRWLAAGRAPKWL